MTIPSEALKVCAKCGEPKERTDFYVQVLCMNRQHGKLMNNGICPHQGTCNDYPEREYSQAAGSAAPLN
jgi:hypothetical protein